MDGTDRHTAGTTCRRCGTLADAGRIFCPKCGAALRAPSALIPPSDRGLNAPSQVSTFDYDPPEENATVDYTGLKIGGLLAPVFFLFVYLGNADMGLAASIVLGMIMFAIKIRWDLRKHVWFWATIVFILALHVPLVLMVRWPQGKTPTIVYTMPIGLADFVIILTAVGLAEELFSKGSSSNGRK